MKKKQTVLYKCSSCGYTSPGTLGKCPECGAWNSFEECMTTPSKSGGSKPIEKSHVSSLVELSSIEKDRFPTSLTEIDRVLGGGLVPGSVILIGGEPGIGKSTLLLQIASSLVKKSESHITDNQKKVLYASGEESPSQIKIRANRLGIHEENILLTFETEYSVLDSMSQQYQPNALIIDSIQTFYTSSLDGSAGSISQIRESTQLLVHLAKKNNITVFIVGHVTKEGNIAGPKFLEHLVDVVLYLEGDKNNMIRLLRSNKNRFGETGELGVFSMKEKGLLPVDDPSEVFLEKLEQSYSGTIIYPSLEGIRTIFLEIQALCTQSFTPVPRRVVNGSDFNRVLMLAAILEKRLKQNFIGLDYFINVTGGTKINDPAADLAIALALLSSRRDTPLPPNLVAFGEIGLSGEIRPVLGAEKRIKESMRRNFSPIIVPKGSSFEDNVAKSDIKPISHISEITSIL